MTYEERLGTIFTKEELNKLRKDEIKAENKEKLKRFIFRISLLLNTLFACWHFLGIIK